MVKRRTPQTVSGPGALALRPNALPAGYFEPEASLPYAFNVVGNRVSLTLEKMYGELYGLSVVGWRIMAILGSHAPLSAKALAELVAMDQVSISRAIEQLTSKRLVSRRVDMADRRRVVLRLTKKGDEIYNSILPLFHASENAIVACLDEDEELTLRRLMKRIVDHSAVVLADEQDWKSLLETFGYEAETLELGSGPRDA